MLLGYTANAQALLVALHQAGFLKDRKINDWKDHNEYHSVFSERARNAANARWNRKESTRKERRGKETSIASRMLVALPTSLKAVENFQKEWEAFRIHRQKLRVPLTPHAEELVLKVLAERPKDAAEAVGVAMTQGWRGFKWEWFDNYKTKGGKYGTHKSSSAESGRGLGTANEGKSNQYKDIGKIRPVSNT